MKENKTTRWYKWFIPSTLILLLVVILTRHKLKSTPAYGLKGWRRLVLAEMLTENAPAISTSQAKQQLGKAIFLDTRSREEYITSHIDNARFVDYKNFSLPVVSDIDKDAPIVVYCSVGKRSGIVAERMKAAGYTDVHNMYGGLFTWFNNGYPVMNMQQQTTDSIHAYNQLWGLFLKKGNKVYN